MRDITYFSAYRTRTYAEAFFLPNNQVELFKILERLDGMMPRVIGAGNNIIFKNSLYDKNKPILCTRKLNTGLELDREGFIVGCGASLRELCLAALQHELSGLESMWDIPSSIGGATVMNAGAYGREFGELIDWIEVYDFLSGDIQRLGGNSLSYMYRQSSLQRRNVLVLCVRISLTLSNKASIRCAMRNIKLARRRKFPYDMPNCGSVFVRPQEGLAASAMIDELGLKGHSIGGAMISKKHAGFIVNTGNASGEDILSLARSVTMAVKESFGVNLIMEQKIV